MMELVALIIINLLGYITWDPKKLAFLIISKPENVKVLYYIFNCKKIILEVNLTNDYENQLKIDK